MKKRLLSVILTLSLVAGVCPIGALAAQDGAAATGELCLTMHRSGAMAATDFAVKLTGAAGQHEGVLHAPADADAPSLTLKDIANGSYTLTVTAPNYLSYTQLLDFEGLCAHVDLYNYAHINAGRTGELYGVMPVGDVDGNGVINDTDANRIAAAIGGSDLKYDLSGDGTVDLTDLAISVRNQGPVVPATAVHTISSAVLAQTVTAATGAGTTAKGNLSDLLDQSKEDTTVTLTPAGSEAITEDTPVELTLTTAETAPAADQVTAQALVIAPPAGSDNTIAAGNVTVEAVDEDGNEMTINARIAPDAPRVVAMAADGLTDIPDAPVPMADTPATPARGVTVESDGTIVINLGQRVAIKKVTIRVTATANQGNLAEIAKVEFLSDFAERIPEPQLSIPTVLAVSNTECDGLGYKNITISWDPQTNVTGYEVKVVGPGYNKTASTDKTSYTFQGDSFNGTVKSFLDYTVTVRSVSGDWKSAWSQPYVHTVTCFNKPPAPQYLSATPGVNSLRVSWNCKFDAQSYTLYYKHPDDASFTAVEGLTSSSHTLQNLQAGVKYTLYVVAHNKNGSSPKSANAEGVPTSPTGVEMPKYKLINVDAADGTASTHITSISGHSNKSYTLYKADGTTVTNANATAEDWKVLLDNEPKSYLLIPDWDSGVSYANFRGPIIQLDKAYTMDTFRMSPFEGSNVHMNAVSIRYKAADGSYATQSASFYTRYDSQNRRYYEVMLPQPITTDYVELRTSTTYGAAQNYTICEVKLYEYDDLENTVAALFADDMRTELKDTVVMDDITALISRAKNTVDPVSGEAHPHKTTILTDLEYAKALLEHKANAHVITVDNQITANASPNGGYAQALSDYQPLGCVAAAGDTVVIYVSDGKTARGSNVELKLVATQYHPQVAAWQSSGIQLKAGRNEITIPKIGSDATERGGSLYLQYTGAKGAKNYTVRSTGGTYIPVLNVDGVTGADRTAAIQSYVAELGAYAAQVQTLHGQLHGPDKENTNVRYDYSVKNCFLNATEICLDNMMYSLPATQVWQTINAGGDPAGHLEASLAAMEQEIDYFYQFKGLHKDATGADAYPYTRLNIRYHQMFTGAFMYAAGKHIGIEFGSTGSVLGLTPVVADANGKYLSGKLSGWGISHEIGHCINSPAYQRVEVTNNLFAQLSKVGNGKEETSANFRTTYDNVYKAVATGTTGHTGNLAVQLAMYWQLHLAYDNSYAYKLYDSAADAQANLFYARLESYLRDKSKALYPFTASGGDQLFMQAACAAAGKDVLSFFRAWGIIPNADTVAYAAQYPAETRKIQYIDDDSRLYRMEGGTGMSAGTTVTAAITNATSSRVNGNKVTISLANTNTATDAMLGYEIRRNGKMVAFVPATQTSYTDIVTTENNKAFTYTVTAIDRLLGETAPVALPQVKVCHDGAISKDSWSVQTNMTSAHDAVVDKDEDDPESGAVSGTTLPSQEKVSAITAAIDNDPSTVYFGSSTGARPYILLDLGGVEQVTAVKFTPAGKSYSGAAAAGSGVDADKLFNYRLFGYTVEISLDGSEWTTVKAGNSYTGSAADSNSWKVADDVIVNNADDSYTLFFNKKLEDGSMDPYMYTYDAAYIRVTATDMSKLAVAEIDVLGPTSDNVELVSAGFGRLSADFTSSGATIPAGSVVFYGEYKGDPSYNLVLLKDQNGKVLDGQQLILAQVTTSGALGETSDGRWVFWLEDQVKTDDLGDSYNEMDQLTGLTTVQAELYRVQNAQTLAGQRLTSTSLTMDVPTTVPTVTLTSSANVTAYAPSAAAVAYAAAGAEEVAAPASDVACVAAVALGDTGAAEGETISPIHLTSDGAKFTAQFRPSNATDIATQADLTLSAAPAGVTVQPTVRDDLYQSYHYDRATGKLKLFAVARQSGLGDGTIAANVTPAADCTMTATALSLLSSSYALSQVEDLPSVSVKLSQTTTDSGSSGGTGGGGGGGGSTGGGGGGSSKPATTPVTPEPTQQPTQPAALPFTDVAAGSWYEEAVRYVYDNQVMQGTGDNIFAPSLTTSRAMLVTVLYRLCGAPAVETQAAFTDVAPDTWYTAAVSWASANGIVTGYDADHFGPNDDVTRQQMVAILYRYAKYRGCDVSAAADLSGYTDAAEIQPYATDAFVWAVGAGLVNGMTDTTLAPTGSGTRAQIATILYRLCQNFPAAKAAQK